MLLAFGLGAIVGGAFVFGCPSAARPNTSAALLTPPVVAATQPVVPPAQPVVAAQPVVHVEQRVVQPAAKPDEDPIAVVRSCRYNQRCVIERLRNRTDSPSALAILIEAYRAEGMHAQKRRAIATLRRLYPNSREARQQR